MNTPYTLVIIDVQTGFPAARNPKLRAACLREIREAKKNNCPIIFVEYESSGVTYSNLVSATKNYNKTYVVSKNNDDGSTEVSALIYQKRLPRATRVCGVNTTYCVFATVVGLNNFFRKVMVVQNACYDEQHKTKGWQIYNNLPRVEMVGLRNDKRKKVA